MIASCTSEGRRIVPRVLQSRWASLLIPGPLWCIHRPQLPYVLVLSFGVPTITIIDRRFVFPTSDQARSWYAI
jgi:hypothetical protein